MPQPFSIEVPATEVSELRRRLAATRWPDEISNEDWEYGTNRAYLQDLCRHWQDEFDWSKQESHLNSFPHFRETVNGTGIHFIHQKGTADKVIPILLIHGWPDSFVRFLRLIPLLSRDLDGLAFDVVVPSIPGFGFSDRTVEPGMNPKKIAGLFHDLMKELGYEKFVVHGGDWGSTIAEALGLYHSSCLMGIHLTDVPAYHSLMPLKDAGTEEQKYLDEMKEWEEKEGGYFMIQSTKPQTLAYGLNDSPAGVCGWMVEKFKTWTDNKGKIEDAVNRSELLTNISIYWFTQTINSAQRIYYEAMHALNEQRSNPLQKINPFNKTGDKTDVPTGFSFFPRDLARPPKEFAARFFPIWYWTVLEEGGHFTAMEEPRALAKEIRKFAALLLKQEGKAG